MKNTNTKKIATSLKTQMIISFLCVGIIPLILFSLISSIIMKSSMYNREIMSLKQISSMLTDNLDRWGDDNIVLVDDMASSQTIQSNNIENIQFELKNKQGQDTDIYNILYVDVNGFVLADALGSKNENISNEDYFKDMNKEYSYISDVIIDSEKKLSFMIFSSPVKSDNKVIGYIINQVKTSSIKDNIGNIFYSDQGEIFTYNHDGLITYHPDSDKIMHENIFNNSDNLSEGAKKALDGNFNSIKYANGETKGVAVYNYIPSLNWGTITTTPNSDIYKGFNNVLWSAVPLIIFIILIILCAAIYILKLITNPISEMGMLTQSVAQGDLTVQCDLNGSREINMIGQDLNKMVNALKSLVLSISNKSSELKDASIILDELSSAAEENTKDISKAMTEISSSSVGQASKTEAVLTQVKNLDKKMIELVHSIDETNDLLKESNIALLKGRNGTQQLKNNTNHQYELVSQAVSQVNELSEFVSNVDDIIESISEIADQTSLLSLNASIEAARAGESGKGFAVVAEEVGKLANESQNATRRTTDILNNIKSKADLTTKIMRSINEGMLTHSSTVNETINIFNEITESDTKISDNIKSFTNLIDYIKDFNNDLLELIETLASSAEESAAVSEEVTASSDEQISIVEKVRKSGTDILKIVDELKTNIEKFTIEK